MPSVLIFLLVVIFLLAVFGLLVLRGTVIRNLKAAVIRSEVLIRTIRTKANEYDRMDSVLSGAVIDLINTYDADRLKGTQ